MVTVTAIETAASYGLLTVRDVTTLLDIGDEGVKNRIRAGTLAAMKAGPIWLVPEKKLWPGSSSARSPRATRRSVAGRVLVRLVFRDEVRGGVRPGS